MINGIGLHRSDQNHIICNLADLRQDFGKLHPTLPLRSKCKLRPQQRRVGIDECRAISLEQVRWWKLPIAFPQLGLWIVEFQLARGPRLEHVDHTFDLAGEMRGLWRQRPRTNTTFFSKNSATQRCLVRLHQLRCRNTRQAHSTLTHKPSALQKSRTGFEQSLWLLGHNALLSGKDGTCVQTN